MQKRTILRMPWASLAVVVFIIGAIIPSRAAEQPVVYSVGASISGETSLEFSGSRLLDIVFSNKDLPQTIRYTVEPGDTLGKIASIFGTTVDLVRISNHLQTDMIRPGQLLRIWAAPFKILISKKDNVLQVTSAGELVKQYPVATGADNITPVGEFTISSRLENPVWFKKGVPVAADDPHNALGTRWLGFDKPQYGIHGTIHPEMIGKQVSKGCVRMLNADVEELFLYIAIGTGVRIIDGPIETLTKGQEAQPVSSHRMPADPVTGRDSPIRDQ